MVINMTEEMFEVDLVKFRRIIFDLEDINSLTDVENPIFQVFTAGVNFWQHYLMTMGTLKLDPTNEAGRDAYCKMFGLDAWEETVNETLVIMHDNPGDVQ